mgnify:CR=1 FL=1
MTPYIPNKECPPTKEQRDLIELELLALGETYIEAMPTMTSLHEDLAINYSSKYVKDSNGHVTCTTYRI